MKIHHCLGGNPHARTRGSSRRCRSACSTSAGANRRAFATAHCAADDRPKQCAANRVAGSAASLVRALYLVRSGVEVVALALQLQRLQIQSQFRASAKSARFLDACDLSKDGGATRNRQHAACIDVARYGELHRRAVFGLLAIKRLARAHLEQSTLGEGYGTLGMFRHLRILLGSWSWLIVGPVSLLRAGRVIRRVVIRRIIGLPSL